MIKTLRLHKNESKALGLKWKPKNVTMQYHVKKSLFKTHFLPNEKYYQ